MRKRYQSLLALLLLSTILLQSSCQRFQNQQFELDTWEPDLALALINTRASIQDVLDNFETGGFISVDPDGFLTLVYQGTVISVDGSQIANIPDFNLNVPDSFYVASYSFDTGDFIDRLDLKGGTATYNASSNLAEDVEVTLQFPSSNTSNGQPLERSFLLDHQGSTPVTTSGTLDLTGVRFDFNANNEFPIRYVARRLSNGQRVTLQNFSINFQNLEASFLSGYVGSFNFDLPADSIVLDVFNNWTQGSIFFEEPKVDVIVNNSIGIPIRATFNDLSANTNLNGLVNLNYAPLSNGLDFNYPSINEIGQVKQTVLSIDANSSNLPAIIGGIPFEVYYDFKAALNPDNDNSIIGHLTDSSRFSIDVNVAFPLFGRANDFGIEDEFDLDWSIYEEFEYVNFKLITENGFPAEALMQLYFLDAGGNVLDSLLADPSLALLEAAPVDASGRVTEVREQEIVSDFPPERYARMRDQARRIRLVARFQTENNGDSNQSVRIYSDYRLGLQLGASGGLRLD